VEAKAKYETTDAEKAKPRKSQTIKIQGGAEYAKVATRLVEFHEDNPECSIETTVDFKDGWAMFRAEVKCPRGTFSAHSLGNAKAAKAFEKLESIAVGRALAYAGYMASGEIASFEEMQAYRSGGSGTNPVRDAMATRINDCQDAKSLHDQRNRVREMVEDKTIDSSLGMELYILIGDRAEHIGVEVVK